MPIVEVHSPADMIVSLEGPQPVRLYPNIPAEINVYLFDTVAFKGFDGKSCYEYAVEGGYKGTEAEFTACMNKWLNEVCQADPIFSPHSAYFGFNAAETISDATMGTLTHDLANTLAAREWPVTNSQSPTPLYAHIVVPATVASYINTVGIKGGLAGIWGQSSVTIGGQPYIDIRSPYKFADASLTLVTTSKSGSISAMTWVTTNGQTILAHIANNAIHLSSQDRAKLDNLSGVNTGDQDLSGLEPKKGVDDFYITNAEKNQGALATGVPALPTVNDMALQVSRAKDSLVVDFTIPADTTTTSIEHDKYGNLLSTADLTKCTIYFSGLSNNNTPARAVAVVRLNDIATAYKVQTITNSTGFYSFVHGIMVNTINIDIVDKIAYYSLNSITSLVDYTNPNSAVHVGYRENIMQNKINKITIVSVSGYNILAGSTIKIYRNG